MEGIKNLLTFLNENWTLILVCIGLIVSIGQKTIAYFSKTDEEKIEIAKKQIEQAILQMITEAEKDYASWSKAGEIKRSKVIEKIYEKYPVLSKAVDQDALIQWIDEEIKKALVTLRKIIENNNENKDNNDDQIK